MSVDSAAFYDAVSVIALFVIVISLYAVLRLGRRRVVLFPLVVVAISVLIGGCAFWNVHRPLPTPERRMLFQGVEYIREVRYDPLEVIHVVQINLYVMGIRFFVTPDMPVSGGEMPARTTSQFVSEFGVQLAINGDFFDPSWDYGIWDYYPHVGDPINPRGLSSSDGVIYSEGYAQSEAFSTLYFTANNGVSFTRPPIPIENAISGYVMLVQDGEAQWKWGERDGDYFADRHPRTVACLDTSGRFLNLVLVDGRQPRYSEGMTIAELIQLMLDLDCQDALNLDGGGSVTLVVEGADGQPEILNSPIHNRIPGRERPIANHLGLYALPVAAQ